MYGDVSESQTCSTTAQRLRDELALVSVISVSQFAPFLPSGSRSCGRSLAHAPLREPSLRVGATRAIRPFNANLRACRTSGCEKTVSVTDGSFIGSNFVANSLGESGTKIVNLDTLAYADNGEILVSIRRYPDHVFIKGSIGDQALFGNALGASSRCDRKFYDGDARRSFDRRPRWLALNQHGGYKRLAGVGVEVPG